MHTSFLAVTFIIFNSNFSIYEIIQKASKINKNMKNYLQSLKRNIEKNWFEFYLIYFNIFFSKSHPLTYIASIRSNYSIL